MEGHEKDGEIAKTGEIPSSYLEQYGESWEGAGGGKGNTQLEIDILKNLLVKRPVPTAVMKENVEKGKRMPMVFYVLVFEIQKPSNFEYFIAVLSVFVRLRFSIIVIHNTTK